MSLSLIPMRFKLAVMLCLWISGSSAAAPTSCNLGELLSLGDAAVRSYIPTLAVGEIGPGIKLCDGDTILRGWRFTGAVTGLDPSQHVYLFDTLHGPRAVAWVDPHGRRLKIPNCPSGARCQNLDEPAFSVSEDVYTDEYVRPDRAVVLITYPAKQWNSAAVEPSPCPVSMPPAVEQKLLSVLDASTESVLDEKAYDAVFDQLLYGKDDASIEARVALMDYPIGAAYSELLSCVVSTGGKKALYYLNLYSRCDIAPTRSPVPRDHTNALRSITMVEWKAGHGKGSCEYE